MSSHQSSFDGRALYYRVHLDRCDQLLAATGAAIHPGLLASRPSTTADVPAAPPAGERRRPSQVLFVCTGNGSRSQIAEALLRDMDPNNVEVVSAGSQPKPIHPNAIKVLAERGIDISSARSKPLSEFTGRHFDHVITVCDKVREICPEFPGQRRATHWSIEDPSRLPGSLRTTLPAFRAVAADLESRLRFLITAIEHDPHKEHTHHG